MPVPRSPHPAVLITGLGSLSALGHSARAIEEAYAQGGSRLMTRSVGDQQAPVGALSADTEAALAAFAAAHPRRRELDRSVLLAVYAADRAVADAGWCDRAELGVVVGSSRGATGLWEEYYRAFLQGGDARTPSLTSPTTTLGNLSSSIAQHLAGTGPTAEISATCSTSLSALAIAMAWLRAGMASRFLAGGAEAPLTPFTLAQMRALRVYAKDANAPYPCRPCAQDAGRRNTMVLGEGACMLALEPWSPERVQADACLGVLRGVGLAVESISTPTSLSERGDALALAMQRALGDAALERVDAVVTHTPGTSLGDRAELCAIAHVFGDDPPVLTSNKWILGHTLGASGALAVEYALYMLRHQRWVEYPYPVRLENRARPLATVMVNSVGFGGNAASVIVSLPRTSSG